MISMIDILEKSTNSKELKELKIYLDAYIKNIKGYSEDSKTADLIYQFNNRSPEEPFSNWIFREEDFLMLSEVNYKEHRKNIKVYLDFSEYMIDFENCSIIEKINNTQNIMICHFFYEDSFGLSVNCIDSKDCIVFNFEIEKNIFTGSFNTYQDLDNHSLFNSTDPLCNNKSNYKLYNELYPKRESFLKALLLLDLLESKSDTSIIYELFNIIFNNTILTEDKCDEILMQYDIKINDIFDNSFIFKIPNDFYD